MEIFTNFNHFKRRFFPQAWKKERLEKMTPEELSRFQVFQIMRKIKEKLKKEV